MMLMVILPMALKQTLAHLFLLQTQAQILMILTLMMMALPMALKQTLAHLFLLQTREQIHM